MATPRGTRWENDGCATESSIKRETGLAGEGHLFPLSGEGATGSMAKGWQDDERLVLRSKRGRG